MTDHDRMTFTATVPFRAHGRVRWTARTLALLVAAYALIMGIGSAVTEQEEPLTGTGVGVAVFLAWIVVSMLGAWRWERLGGASGVLAGVAFGFFVYFTAGRNEELVAVAMGLPLVIISVGFLVADRRTGGGSRRTPVSGDSNA